MKAQFVVLTNPVPGREREFHHWYDAHHLGEVSRVPGITDARRMLADPSAGTRYVSCAIYSIDHPSPETVVEDVKARWNRGDFTPTDTMHDDILMQLYR